MSLIFEDRRRLWIFAFLESCLSHESCLYARRLKSLPACNSCFIYILYDTTGAHTQGSVAACLVVISWAHTVLSGGVLALWIFAFLQSCLSHESCLYTRRLKSLPAWHSCFISILVWYLYLSSGFLLCTSSCFATSGSFVYFVFFLCIFIVSYDTYICFSYAIFVRHLVW
jgi:hypothetical protein